MSNGGGPRRRRLHLPEPLGLRILISGGVQLRGHKTTSVRRTTGAQTSWSRDMESLAGRKCWNDPEVPAFLWGGGAGTDPKLRLPLLIKSASLGVCKNNSIIKSRATAAKTGEHRLELPRNVLFRRTLPAMTRLLFSL